MIGDKIAEVIYLFLNENKQLAISIATDIPH